MSWEIVGRGIRFSAVGAIYAGVSFVVFVAAAPHMHFEIANVVSWAAGIGVGFALNRRVTFRRWGREGLPREAALFVLGSLGQLALSAAGYAVLMGGVHLSAPLAFVLCTAFTALCMFVYHEVVTFRPVRKRHRNS